IRAKNSALATVVAALLCPVNLSAYHVECNANAPISGITTVRFALTRLDECLNRRSIQIRTHDAHALSVRPVKLPVLLVELELLRSKRAAGRNDVGDVCPVDVGAFDGTVVRAGVTHIGPVDVSRRNVDHDAVRKAPALRDDRS